MDEDLGPGPDQPLCPGLQGLQKKPASNKKPTPSPAAQPFFSKQMIFQIFPFHLLSSHTLMFPLPSSAGFWNRNPTLLSGNKNPLMRARKANKGAVSWSRRMCDQRALAAQAGARSV